MKRNNHRFDATARFEELDDEEKEDLARRLQAYSPAVLKLGAKVDMILVLHTRFQDGLQAADRIFQIAREVTMPHGMRLMGPPGSGKTVLMKYFSRSVPDSTLFSSGLGCVGIRASQRATGGQLISDLLRVYKYPFCSTSQTTVYLKKGLLCDLIAAKGTRLIFIDEAHRLLRQSKRRTDHSGEPEATAMITEIMDEANVGVVLIGSRELDQLETVDPFLADRISVRMELTHFAPDQEWMGLLRAFIKNCTWFDLGLIDSEIHAKQLHQYSCGNLRQLKRLLTEVVLIGAQAERTAANISDFQLAFALVRGKDTQMTCPFV